MSYRLEKKDIVLSGMEDGIADSPYDGIADMRNINIIGVPGEGSVQYKETPAIQPPALNSIAFTAAESTDRFTWAGPNTLYEGVAISLTFPTFAASVLGVAGGGGGGGGNTDTTNGGGGGGGAGGLLDGTINFTVGAHTITIGTGGLGGVVAGVSPGTQGANGTNTVIGTFSTLIGGGGGGGAEKVTTTSGNAGGSGGGAGAGSSSQTANGGAATASQGNAGGTADTTGANHGGGGGGGANAVGSNGAASGVGAAGGTAHASSISGSSVSYGGGGGGGANSNASAGGVAGTNAGTGGGSGGAATSATANRGGGGGGGRGDTTASGGNGGSGIVIISYVTGTINATGGTITTSGGNTIHTFTTSGVFTVIQSGLATGTVYYVRNIVGLTFQLSAAVYGDIILFDGDSTGFFTTYQYGNQRGLGSSTQVPPIAYIVDRALQNGVMNGIYMTDLSNYVWFLPAATSLGIQQDHLIFLGNIGGIGASTIITTGLNLWKGFIFLFGVEVSPVDVVDVADLQEIFVGAGPTASWSYTWWNNSDANSNGFSKIPTLVGQDDVLYYISQLGVGSIMEVAGETFDPTDSATYTRTATALTIPRNDRSTCLAELGVNLLVGGRNAFIYPWDRVSTSFTYPLLVPENYTVNIVGTNQNAYIFAGNRGRIFITNGSAIDEYKKVSDYVTGILNPYYKWRDASFARNQLYFSFTATTNADVVVDTVNAAWAVDLKKDAMYCVNKITNTGYSGAMSMVTEMPANSLSNQPNGTSLTLGWRVSNTYGLDVGSTEPYSGGESFIDFDIIPIGTFFNNYTPSQFEWKVSQPLGGNGTPETVRLLYRVNLADAFTEIGTTTLSGATEATVALSDSYQTNFEKAQWLQIRLELTSNATTPTFCRFYEIRIRDYNA